MGNNRQKSRQLELSFMRESKGEAQTCTVKRGKLPKATHSTESPVLYEQLMEEICERNNLKRALKRVKRNKGGPGVDGMTTTQLPGYLKEHWLSLKEQLLEGNYQPQPVKRVEIPKDKGTRQLGIPTVLDRFIQQAALQVLQKIWEPAFSEHSYGFRPKRSAHQAVAQAQKHIADGFTCVVDLDLEKFFDRVNHDRLMSRVAKKVKDKRVLKLLRAFLNAGVMENGLVGPTDEGTPQGGPLSPLLSNIMLNDLDKELEKRGHRFCRYADDCNIYVKSRRAGKRVMKSVSKYITKRLKLKVNRSKSSVGSPSRRKFLGFSIIGGKTTPPKRRIATKSLIRFKNRVRRITRRTRGISVEQMIQELSRYLIGWRGYFGSCETRKVLRDLDSWIRRRLRSVIWHQWRTFRKRRKGLIQLGVGEELASITAFSSKGPWAMSRAKALGIALSTNYFDSLGLARVYVK